MTIIKKFVLTFTLFTSSLICFLSAISILFIKSISKKFSQQATIEYIHVLIPRISDKAIITYIVLILITTLVSIPFGLFLYRMISKRYFDIFNKFRNIAHQRLLLRPDNKPIANECSLLETYLDTLINDLKIVQSFQKMLSWKNGARMLMHELRNPLTPLKLASQRITLNTQNMPSIQPDIQSIQHSITDLEKILSFFKNLVNIEFGICEPLDLKSVTEATIKDLLLLHPSFEVFYSFQTNHIIALCDKTLLRMLITNLVTNGLEENSEGFSVYITENNTHVTYDFLTKNRTISHPDNMFKLGYSSKGQHRGIGLFLCKQISEYLDAHIHFINRADGVVFSFMIAKISRKQ